jgi:hypothetical protein
LQACGQAVAGEPAGDGERVALRVGQDQVVADAADANRVGVLVGEAQRGVGALCVEAVDAVAVIYRERGSVPVRRRGVAALSGGNAGVAVGDDDEVVGLAAGDDKRLIGALPRNTPLPYSPTG